MNLRLAAASVVVIAILVVAVLWLQSATGPPPLDADEMVDRTTPSPSAPTPIEAAPSLADQRVRLDEPSSTGLEIRGLLIRRGLPVAGRAVQSLGGLANGQHTVAYTTTRADGRFRFDVAPGSYEVAASKDPRFTVRDLDKLDAMLRVTGKTLVEVVDRSVDCTLELPPGRIDIVVRDRSTGAPVPRAWVNSNISRGWNAWHESTRDDGRAVFDEVEFGDYEFHAIASLYRPARGHTVTVGPTAPLASIMIEMDPASDLLVSLEDEDRTSYQLPWDGGLEVVHVESGILEVQADRHTKTPRWTAEFRSLVPGRYRVCVRDERDEGENTVRFQRVACESPTEVELRPGERHAVTIEVVPRSHVRLVGRSSDRPDRKCRANVTAIDAPYAGVTALPVPWQEPGTLHRGTHFDGYLVPGRYEITFTTDDGRAWSEWVTIDHTHVTLTFELPW